jgi:hypothetical protein
MKSAARVVGESASEVVLDEVTIDHSNDKSHTVDAVGA